MDQNDLCQALAQNSSRWQVFGSVYPQILEQLSTGQPVTPAFLAELTGLDSSETAAVLQRMPNVELDTDGNLVGAGITLNPTPHQFRVNSSQVYTWCALDTLLFAIILGKPATVDSPSPVSGKNIHMKVAPDRVLDLEPPSAVVSLLVPEQVDDIRSAFCNYVHFFTSAEEAEPWLVAHPDATIMPVSQAYPLARQMAELCLSTASDGDVC